MKSTSANQASLNSRGININTGRGPSFQIIDINHPDYVCLIAQDKAFWSLVSKDELTNVIVDKHFIDSYKAKANDFQKEMDSLRFSLALSAVYINPTARCNLNCSYCYIPEEMRLNGNDMSKEDLMKSLNKLKTYFKQSLPEERRPQIIFHGAEPFLCKDIIFSAIEKYNDYFKFGIQTNGTLLDDESAEFIKSTGTGIGLSLDAPIKDIADLTRKTWSGDSVFDKTLESIDRMKGYSSFNVICTITNQNMTKLKEMIDFFHKNEVSTVLMNMLRCTLPSSRDLKPEDHIVAKHFIEALDYSHDLYKQTGRKIIVGNFANVLISILAPMARRLMCDISPCGGGRVFFALGPNADMFPCSEFIGLDEFNGGNLLIDNIKDVLNTPQFKKVTERLVEDIVPCKDCVIKHFCGSPCPAEAHEMFGSMKETGAFCEFYEKQVRYAFRLIADEKYQDFLWDDWDTNTETTFNYQAV